ncbi:MAG: FtsQ-type POTRA domain-containing protein, partial [Clostridia bacterium]|nr:FtsQ-type POTRA domain-containing protein [Clostridia bacterium]
MANSVDRYYQKKKRRKKKIKIVFFGLLFILMMLTLGILSVTVFFNAEEIIVEGNTRYTAKELLEQGELSVGQNLFRLDKFKTIEKMQEFPYVK